MAVTKEYRKVAVTECPICYEEMAAIWTYRVCKHPICYTCHDKMRRTGKSDCPLCRRPSDVAIPEVPLLEVGLLDEEPSTLQFLRSNTEYRNRIVDEVMDTNFRDLPGSLLQVIHSYAKACHANIRINFGLAMMLNTTNLRFLPTNYNEIGIKHEIFKTIQDEAISRLRLYPSRGAMVKFKGLHPTRTILTMTDGSRMNAIQSLVHTLHFVDGFPLIELEQFGFSREYLALAAASFESSRFLDVQETSPCDYTEVANQLIKGCPIDHLMARYYAHP